MNTELVPTGSQQRLGAGVRLGLMWGWLPCLQFLTDRTTFVRITSQSTLALALVLYR